MNQRHTIPAVDKALTLIEVLAEAGAESTSAELSRRLGIAPSTCYRILQTLVAHDWLRPVPGGSHVFSTGLLPLLEPLSDYQQLFESLSRPLERVVEATGLTAKISVKRGDRALTVFRVESSRGFSPTSKIGASFHLAYGSSGSCLLSGMTDAEIDGILEEAPKEVWQLQKPADVRARVRAVREEGVCYDPGQFHGPVHGVSAPVYGPEGGVFSTVTLVGWPDDFKGRKLAALKKEVAACASACGRTLNLKAAA